MRGYGIQTADEGLDPVQWQVSANSIHPKTGVVMDSSLEISFITDDDKKEPWTLT